MAASFVSVFVRSARTQIGLTGVTAPRREAELVGIAAAVAPVRHAVLPLGRQCISEVNSQY